MGDCRSKEEVRSSESREAHKAGNPGGRVGRGSYRGEFPLQKDGPSRLANTPLDLPPLLQSKIRTRGSRGKKRTQEAHAAAAFPWVRSVGWDLAVSEGGPVLVEGNERWSTSLIQMPAPHGLMTGEFKALYENLDVDEGI